MTIQALELLISKLRPMTSNLDLIRLGGDEDGGYLLPDDLNGISGCFSPGVSNVVNFEIDMLARQIPCYLMDASIEECPLKHELVDFERKYLSDKTEGVFLTLADWFNSKTCEPGDFLLQMDIEGAEYRVLLEAPETLLKKFRIMIIEFHYLTSAFDALGYILVDAIFSKLLRDFHIIHIHPNNCCPSTVAVDHSFPERNVEVFPVMEFTFIRKDRVTEVQPSSRFPHPLDRKNVPSNPECILPRCWYP